MENRAVYRCHYRARIAAQEPGDIVPMLAQCERNAQKMIDSGRMMTAALYPYGRQLFLYFEALGDPLPPEAFMWPMNNALSPWPQKEELRPWAKMYNIYWHDVPRGEEDWRRKTPPQQRRGRIAYLKNETMFRYVYYHVAIVEEGKLKGDRYQSIAMHEDVLFSYFEEPKTFVNIRREEDGTSKALEDWTAVNPESHFIHLDGSEGQNFLLLEPLFALGQD